MKKIITLCASLLLILSAVTSVAHAHNCYGSYENTPNQATDDSRQHTEKPDVTKREGNEVQDRFSRIKQKLRIHMICANCNTALHIMVSHTIEFRYNI